MDTIRERSDAVVEKLRLPQENTCVFHRAQQIADAIYEEFRDDNRDKPDKRTADLLAIHDEMQTYLANSVTMPCGTLHGLLARMKEKLVEGVEC